MPDPAVAADVSTDADLQALMRHPGTMVTLDELAMLKGKALEIIEARATVLETARARAIRLTFPDDWVLYKKPEDQGGRITGYLWDAGCWRARPVFGISTFNIRGPVHVQGALPGEFSVRFTGDGRSNLTGEVVEQILGARSSTDDACKGKEGPALADQVEKDARANFEGNVVRRLAGLGSVPAEELVRVWATCTPPRLLEHCNLGRGFGSRDVRLGATAEGVPDVPPPVCPHCKATGVYRPAKGNRGAFFGCPNYSKHPDKKFIEPADAWIAKHQTKATAPAVNGSAPCAVCGKLATEHANADHDWSAA